jgi:hypothetical protein
MMTDARDLAIRLATLLASEHHAMSDFLVALADFDRRRAWAELGFASLWHFLHRDLGLSKGAAFQRKEAAALLQRFPQVESPLRDGRLCLSSVVELSRVLTAENQPDVLPRFFHRSAREARELAAEFAPRDVPSRLQVTAIPTTTTQWVLTSEPSATQPPRDVVPQLPAAPRTPERPSTPLARPPDTTDPLTADLRRLHVTVSKRFLDKLDAARAARSHARPGASAEAILEEALDLLLAREAKRREAAAERPLPTPREASPDRIPAHVRREVWARDEGKCQWPLHDGGICGSTLRLELDHVIPRARGGTSTAANLRVLCAAHNAEAARRVFGAVWLAQRRRTGSIRPPADGAP